MRTIGKDGKVVRLSKASWDFLIPFDSDPNCAIPKIQARIAELEKQAKTDRLVTDIVRQPASATIYTEEKKLQKIIKDTMEEVLRPFMGS